ncbi:MAG: MATE family efflux transporter, partial [Candidatus Sumerlaeia bacterium]|nr:MATE family efflux transporter [Candidatus Sumerlaeia bacterium]
VLMGVAGLIFMFFGRELMRFYIADENVIEMGAKALRLIGAVEFIDAFGMVLSRALQGAGQTKFVMVAEVCVHWFIFLPLAYILGVKLQLGIIGTWLALVTYAVCFALLMLRKFISPEWEMQRV